MNTASTSPCPSEKERPRTRRWHPGVWSVASALLLLPLMAMQFTEEVSWSGVDFLVMGVLLFLACGCYELATRHSLDYGYRSAAGIAIIGSFLLIWINLAVGIIGTENHPANLLYAGVLLLGVIGALLAHFHAQGMFKTMLAMALAMLVVGVMAVLLNPEDLVRQVVLNGFFAGVFALSAGGFRRSARSV